MSQMTQTLTTTPPTDDLIVPFHCDRCGALAKVRVVRSGGDVDRLSGRVADGFQRGGDRLEGRRARAVASRLVCRDRDALRT